MSKRKAHIELTALRVQSGTMPEGTGRLSYAEAIKVNCTKVTFSGWTDYAGGRDIVMTMDAEEARAFAHSILGMVDREGK